MSCAVPERSAELLELLEAWDDVALELRALLTQMLDEADLASALANPRSHLTVAQCFVSCATDELSRARILRDLSEAPTLALRQLERAAIGVIARAGAGLVFCRALRRRAERQAN